MLKIVEGNLFDSKEKYLVHQCNCLTKKAAHLSFDVFRQYPYANIYKERLNGRTDNPGEIIIRGNGKDQRYVINLLGQYYPGPSKFINSSLDGIDARRKYFFSGLQRIAEIDELESVAFPFGVACGAAGGDWEFYYKLIEKFSIFVKDKANVFIYKLEV